MLVLMIAGKARHGKDTLAKALAHSLEKLDITSEILHFADALKEEAKAQGWDGKKDAAGRTLLQDLGNGRRGEDPLYWIKKLAKKVRASAADVVIVPDTRYKNEADPTGAISLHGAKTVKVIRIVRGNDDGTLYDNGLTKQQKAHISEVDLDDVRMPTIVAASGVKYIQAIADDLVDSILDGAEIGCMATYKEIEDKWRENYAV